MRRFFDDAVVRSTRTKRNCDHRTLERETSELWRLSWIEFSMRTQTRMATMTEWQHMRSGFSFDAYATLWITMSGATAAAAINQHRGQHWTYVDILNVLPPRTRRLRVRSESLERLLVQPHCVFIFFTNTKTCSLARNERCRTERNTIYETTTPNKSLKREAEICVPKDDFGLLMPYLHLV